MIRNKFYVEIPDKLQPDAFQPYSIIPYGDWVTIGTANINARDLKDDALIQLSVSGLPNGQDAHSANEKELASLVETLKKIDECGYTIERKQRFEVIDHAGVPAGHDDELKTEVYLGVQYDRNHAQRGIDVLGLNLGVFKLSENSMTINAMPMVRDKDLKQVSRHSNYVGAEIEESASEQACEDDKMTNPMDLMMPYRKIDHESHVHNIHQLAENTSLHLSSGALILGMHVQTMQFPIHGGETGARYVLYQLVDHISIRRNHDIDGISSVVYEGHFRHALFTTRYPFEV